MYQSECLVVSGVREGKGKFEVPDSRLGGSGTVSTGKRRLSAGEYCLHQQCRTVEEKWLFFYKN
jgi:hypothetical protein